MSQKSFERRSRVSKAIQRELARLIESGSLNDDRLESFISIVEVDLSYNLSFAKVYFSILNDDSIDKIGDIAAVQAALDEKAGFMRGIIARKINLRYAPKLKFIHTDSLEKSVEIVSLINSLDLNNEEVYEDDELNE